jgi:hypothetical protein
MTDEGRLKELLLRWQQSLAGGREESVEDLCRDCPELAGELRRRIGILRRMSDFVQRLQSGNPPPPVPSPALSQPHTKPGNNRHRRSVALVLLLAAVGGVVVGLLLSWGAPPWLDTSAAATDWTSRETVAATWGPTDRSGSATGLGTTVPEPPAAGATLRPVARVNLDCGVTGAAFVGDGKRFACAGSDGSLRILDVQTGAEVRRVAAHAGRVHAIAASADRARLLSGGEDGFVRVWDVRGGKMLEVEEAGPVHAVAFAADGKTFVSGDAAGNVRLRDAATGREVWKTSLAGGPVRSVAVSPDGLHVAAGGVRAWLGWADDGSDYFTSTDHRDVSAVGFAPDGATFAVAATNGPMPVLWETGSGLPRTTFQIFAQRLTFSPDGWLVALGGQGRDDVGVFSRLTGKLVVRCAVAQQPGADPAPGMGPRQPRGAVLAPDRSVEVLAFAPDRPLLLGGRADGTLLMWELGAAARAERKPVAVEADKLGQRWKSLASRDGAEGGAGVAALASDPVAAVRLLDSELRPATNPDVQGVEELLRSPRPTIRAAGLSVLDTAGEMADPVLRQFARAEFPEDVRSRLDELRARVRAPAKSPERLRTLRTLEVLLLIGATEGWATGREEDEPAPGVREAREAAWARIARLADGAPGSHLTRRAQAAIQRHREWLLFAD